MKDIVFPGHAPIFRVKSRTLRKTMLIHIGSALLGFLFSRTTAFADFLPFGTAFCAGVSREFSISAIFGVLLGSIHTVNGVPGVIYIGAAGVAVALRFVLAITDIDESLNSMISALSGSVFCGICTWLSYDLTLDGAVRMLGEVLIATGCAYFISVAMPVINSGKRANSLDLCQLTSLLLIVSIFLLSLSPYTIFTLSPSRMLAGTIIIFAARYGRQSVGAVCGIVLGTVLGLGNADIRFIAAAYALSGLICGIFSQLGTALGVITYILGNLAVCMGFYQSQNIVAIIVETAFSALIFAICPKVLSAKAADFFTPAPALCRTDGLRKNLIMRMRFACAALTDVSDSVSRVSDKVGVLCKPTLSGVFTETENNACKNCGVRNHCYGALKDRTYEAFIDMTKAYRKSGSISGEAIPDKFRKRCLNPEKVADELERNFAVYERRCKNDMYYKQLRNAVKEQLSGLSDMLYDMSDELNIAEKYDTAAAGAIDAELRKFGVQATDVCCKYNLSGEMSIEISVNGSSVSLSKLELMKIAENTCSRTFNPPCVINTGKQLFISMSEKAQLDVKIGVSQHCCKNERLCGDSYAYFRDTNGRMIMALSDGMGSGRRAYIDSKTVIEVTERLIKAGFGFDCTLKILNSAIMYESHEESLATLDITAIDLFSGQADLFKAGSADTLIIKGRKTGRASCESFPAGIMNDISFDKSSAMLGSSDVVVMMSDGVCDTDSGWIEQTVRDNRLCEAQELADMLMKEAVKRRDDGHDDDITVMVGVVEKN